MNFITIDREKCVHDGICATECPLMLIEFNNESLLPEAVADAEERCLKCGHCVSVCPHEALSVAGIKVQDCKPFESNLHLSVAHAPKEYSLATVDYF
jgi:ferredoxin